MCFYLQQAVFVTYSAAFGLIFLLFSHPWCPGPDKVHTLTAAAFYSTCLGDSKAEAVASEDEDVTTVVYFYTGWSAK